MRLLLFRAVLPALVALLAWLTVGSQISSLVDRLVTVHAAVLPVGPPYAMDTTEFILGARRWIIGSGVRIGPDATQRLTLSTAAGTFTFGPIRSCSSGSGGPRFVFAPEAGDQITFVRRRGWLSWPPPFQFSIMGGPSTPWHRHSYNRMVWTKQSGATLEFLWRDQQSYVAGHGWAEGNLDIAPRITLVPARAAAAES